MQRPSRTDVETMHVLQDNGPLLVCAVAHLMRISEDAALARLYRLKERGLATSRRIKRRPGRLTEWAAVPGVRLLPWEPAPSTKRREQNQKAWAKKKARIAAGIPSAPNMRSVEWTPTQIHIAGEIPQDLPPPTLIGTFSQLINRSDA